MTAFTPEKIPTAEFPFPPGAAVRGGLGSLYIVIDRDGWAFLACCQPCETAGLASGWYPQQDGGRFLPRDLTEADPEWQAACRACVRMPEDIYPCALPAGHDSDHEPAAE